MNASSVSQRLAVCSWSLQPRDTRELLARLNSVGLRRVQLALDPLREDAARWGDAGAALREEGVAVVSGMFGCVGEDYSTLDTIRATGGIAPDATWARNWQNIQAIADVAEAMGLKLVTFHAGFLPHEESDPMFDKLMDRLARVAALFGERGIKLGLETGQETADVLREFLRKLNTPAVGVNFDPANMILYGKGDPVAALHTLGPWISQIHVKDATRTRTPGTWGAEVPVGSGEVNWREFFSTLDEIHFSGDCCIEREAGSDREKDIRLAREFVEGICG